MKKYNAPKKLKHALQLAMILPFISSINIAHAGEFTVGLGGAVTTSEYVSNSKKNIAGVMPFFSYEGERFSIDLDRLSYDVIKYEGLDVSVNLSARSVDFDTLISNSGSFDRKNKQLSGMKKRKIAVESGVEVSFMDLLSVSFLHDLTKAHKGYEIDAHASLPLPLYGLVDELIILPSAGIKFQNDQLVNYQYGVSASESKANRPAYTAKSAVTTYFGLMAVYPINKNTNFMIGTQYDCFDEAITNSPIVDKDDRISGFSAITYTF